MGGKRTGKMFRFQDMEIWKKAIEIADKLFDIAEDLDTERLYRFAEQIRGAGLSMSKKMPMHFTQVDKWYIC